MASNPFPDGRGWWIMRYKPDPSGGWEIARLCRQRGWKKGQPKPKKGVWPRDVEELRREFADIEYRARHGLGAAPARAKGLESYVTAYLDLYRVAQRAASARQMDRAAATFLEYARGRGLASLQAVTRAACRDYLEGRFKGGVSHASLRTEAGYLSGIWARAVVDGLMVANPWKSVRPPGEPAEPTWTFWNPGDIDRIAEACAKPWQADLVLLLGHTGFRLSTGLAMRWGWIDWANGTVKIPPGEDIKTEYLHVLGERARGLLERLQFASASDLVLPNPIKGRESIAPETARGAIYRAVARAGVKAGSPHDLRHSYARNLALSGVPITVVQKQLGHASIEMTMRYSSADEDSVREAITRAERSASAISP